MKTLLYLACAWAMAGAQQPPPAFRADVALLTIRVQVTAARGRDLPLLVPDQFEVRIGGRKRIVVLAEPTRTDDGLDAAVAPSGNAAPQASGDDGFFKPIPGQKSAMYILGLEATGERTPNISVKVKVKDVAVQRWAWCMAATNCGPSQ
jgi:hypothetical protein